MHPTRGGGHRHDHRPGRLGQQPPEFAQANFLAGVCPGCFPFVQVHTPGPLALIDHHCLGHHRPFRHHLPRSEFRRHFQRLQLREPEEPGKNLRPVVLRHHGCQDRGGGEAEPPVLDWLEHLREPRDEPGRRAPVVGGGPGELESPVEVVEERCMPQVPERLSAVELPESGEECSLRVELRAEEIGEMGVEGAGVEGSEVDHGGNVPCEFRASRNAPGRAPPHSIERRIRPRGPRNGLRMAAPRGR